jgi:endonuclease G
MIPQAPENNREVWRELEQYSRDLVRQGNTLYIVAGGEGKQKAIGQGKITVPKYTWKVILVLDRFTNVKETIAVMMPNNDRVANTDWQDYIVSVDEVEKRTGYDFFNTLDKETQRTIESQVYRQE